MLHAFDDSSTVNAGKETWAFVPKALFSSGDPNDTASRTRSFVPAWGAQLSRAGFPFSTTSSTSMRRRASGMSTSRTRTPPLRQQAPTPTGARSWWADSAPGVAPYMRSMSPTPVASTDTESRSRRPDACCGNSPKAISATCSTLPPSSRRGAYGWVALVASGYNNPGGKGFLYVLNPKTGLPCIRRSARFHSPTIPVPMQIRPGSAPSVRLPRAAGIRMCFRRMAVT